MSIVLSSESTQVEKLKAKGVDAIIVIAHMGIENENKIPDTGMRDVINAVDGIDVVSQVTCTKMYQVKPLKIH